MEFIGYIAGIGSLIGYLPQTIKTLRTRRTDDLSLATFLVIGSSAILWTIYGIGTHKLAICIPNAVVAACSLLTVVMKCNQLLHRPN
jgi:MtN3 and saliva related transmembrane protein